MSTYQSAAGARSRGYTLIELVLVIIIAGILAMVAGPHFFDQATFYQRGHADTLAAALRLAQKTAVATDCPTQVTITSGAYAVAQQAASGNTCNPSDSSWSTPVLGPDGTAVAGSAPAGVSTSPTGAWVYSGSGALASAPSTTITVGTHTLSIDATTGYVRVQ
jgi:MSHA pilin protein MshC